MASQKPPRLGFSLPPLADEGDATSITSFVEIQKELAKRQPQLNAYLIVLQGSNVGAMIKVDGPELTLGRSSQATVRIEDDGVSRRHARIVRLGDQVMIEDLNSANGTIVNGEKSNRQVLKDGDKIRIGSTTILKFTYHDNLDESFQQQMYEAAIRDGLTKAYNKKFLLDRLETEFAYAKRHKTPLALIMYDLDHFKKLNDTFGHIAGDLALQTVSRITLQLIRAEDVFARYGGEEFSILCRGVSGASAGTLAERVRASIAGTNMDWQGTRLPVSCSMGVAALPEVNAGSGLELIGAADGALYESKRSGRNRVTICLPGTPA